MVMTTMTIESCWVLILMLFLPRISRSDFRMLYFEEQYVMKKSVEFDGMEKEFQSKNIITCAWKCLMNEKCKSYFFNKANKICILQGRTFEVSVETHLKDWMYCYATNTVCLNGLSDTNIKYCGPNSKTNQQCMSEDKVSVSNPTCTNWSRSYQPYPGKKYALWRLSHCPSLASCHESCLKDIRCIRFAYSDEKTCIGLGEDGKEKEDVQHDRQYDMYVNCRYPGYLNVACDSNSDCCFEGALCSYNKCICKEGYFHQGKRACSKERCKTCGLDFYLISRGRPSDKPVDKAQIEKCFQSKKGDKTCPFIYLETGGTCKTFDVDEIANHYKDEGLLFARSCLALTPSGLFEKVAGFVKAPNMPCPSTRVLYSPHRIDKINEKHLWMIQVEDGDENGCENICLQDERCVVWRVDQTLCYAYSEHYMGRPWGVRTGVFFNKNCRA